jgi:transposase
MIRRSASARFFPRQRVQRIRTQWVQAITARRASRHEFSIARDFLRRSCQESADKGLTDAEWSILEPLFPPPLKTCRKRGWPMREVIIAIFFVLRDGCPWRMLHEHFPPHQTTFAWFARFRDDGTWQGVDHFLLMRDRERVGCEATPSAAIMDSQSIRTTEASGPRGCDVAKKTKGRKPRALTDTDGRARLLQVSAADVRDRDGAVALLPKCRRWFPLIDRAFADTAYAEERVANATRTVVEIVRKRPDQVGFAVLPRRWLVERFFAWLDRNRRLAKDFEGTVASATAFLYAAAVMLLVHRLAHSA